VRGLLPFAALAQEQHVGDDFGAGVALERRERQPNRAEQIRATRKVLAHLLSGIVGGIERAMRRHERVQAARCALVEGLGREVVVDATTDKRRALERLVRDRDVPERHVADHEGEMIVREGRVLEPRGLRVGRRIQRLRDLRGQRVLLDERPVQPVAQRRRHEPDEVADAGAGFKHRPARDAQSLHGIPHRTMTVGEV
jgi:hypothetical protein